MSRHDKERLYNLLPAVYRQNDLERGEPLRSLMAVIEEEMRAIESDIDGLYENWFIETCQEWVVPYIGDLLGVRVLRPTGTGVFSQRAHIANTLAYRHHKGTVFVLERVARDAAGWPARAREFFSLLATTQNLNHVRDNSPATVDLRDAKSLQLLDGPFENAAHTIEVGSISNGMSRYNIKNAGIFLWRLQSYAVTKSNARHFKDGCYWFNPLGYDAPLFNRPQTEQEITQLAEEINVPGMLRRQALYDELESRRQSLEKGETPKEAYFGEQPVFQVFLGDVAVLPEEIIICSLQDWDNEDFVPPCSKKRIKRSIINLKEYCKSYECRVAVDPDLGRLVLLEGAYSSQNMIAAGIAAPVKVSYSYGLCGDIGGGPYNRIDNLLKWIDSPEWELLEENCIYEVSQNKKSLKDALLEWKDYAGRTENAIGLIIITDSGSYDACRIELPPDSSLAIVAATRLKGADWKKPADRLEPDRLRPHLRGDLIIEGILPGPDTNPSSRSLSINAVKGNRSELFLDGLLIEGKLEVKSSIGRLRLSDCTLVPENGGLLSHDNADATNIEMQSCICGPIKLTHKFSGLIISDSIIDGLGSDAISAKDAQMQLLASTILGGTAVLQLSAENSIFMGKVTAQRVQTGCIRFCILPYDSKTPRRYRCQPDQALNNCSDIEQKNSIIKKMIPTFTSLHYRHPGYGQLGRSVPVEIWTGSEDGSEIGAFNSLKQPQREANLRDCMDEYLHLGLDAGIFYVD